MNRYHITTLLTCFGMVCCTASTQAIPITGPVGGQIFSVATTAPLNTINGGSLSPDAVIDTDITGVAGTFNEWNFNGVETYTFTLNGLYDITQFRLWNDRGVADSGIGNFDLIFKDAGAVPIGLPFNGTPVGFQGNNPVPEVFNVGLRNNVKSVDLIVNSTLTPPPGNQLQFREVEFEGTSVPEPGSAVMALLGITVCGFVPRRKRTVSNVTK